MSLATPLPSGKFSVIYADPPWRFTTRSPKGEGRSASQHYQTMSLADIKALPVADLAADDCVLLMWATDPTLEAAFDVIESWGFTYKTVGFYWVKTNRKSEGFFKGCGYWTRANPEQCLLATRGHPKRVDKNVDRLLISKLREHSRKPDQMYPRIERLVAGPYCELFARGDRPGWTSWGNEVGKFSEKEVSTDLILPAA